MLAILENAGSEYREASQTGWIPSQNQAIASQTFAILSQSIAKASHT